MSTKSRIIVRVKKDDIGKEMKFDSSVIGINDVFFDSRKVDLTEKVKIECPYLSVYCHSNGYLDGVGSALKESVDTYDKALNLVIGGDMSILDKNSVVRYAKRVGEEWQYIKPKQNFLFGNMFDEMVDYIYLFEDGKWRYMYTHDIEKLLSEV